MSCCDDNKDWHPHCGKEWHKPLAGCDLAVWVHNGEWTWYVRGPCGQAWQGPAIDEKDAKISAMKIARAYHKFYFYVKALEGKRVKNG